MNLERIEMELEFYSRYNPIALVLPSLYSELKEKALKTIVSEIKRVKYINQIIVTLGRANKEEFEHAKEFFSGKRLRMGVLGGKLKGKTVSCEPKNDFIFHHEIF